MQHARSCRGRCTRDDLILAAFQGPVLGLSSPVVHQYRTFTAELLVRPAWLEAHGLTPSDVATAVLGARVCKPGPTLSSKPLECPKCGRVLDVRPLGPGASTVEWDFPVGEAAATPGADASPGAQQQQQAEAALPGGLESFRVALRTRCTSSRQHLKCPTLALVVVLGPGLAVRSEPFAVYARHAARHLRSAPDSSDIESESAALLDKEASPGAVVATTPGAQVPPLVCSMAVGVKIVTANLSYDDGIKLDRGLVPVILERTNGLLLQKKSTLAGGLVIVVLAFRTREELEVGMNLGFLFVMNKIRNPLNRNLVADGSIRRIAVITNC
eukprot:m51a1_g13967 hypothetical protein (328) ;mRNA; r:973082-974279